MKKSQHGRAPAALARVVVSALLLGILFWQAEPERVIDHLRKLSPAFILFAWAYYAACQFLSSYRWQLFLTAKNVSVPVTSLFSYYMIGMFLNNFLPGAVGGDAVKTYYLYQRTGDANTALSSVFLERFSGLLGLGILSIVALAIGLRWVETPLILATVGGSALLLFAVAMVLWWPPLFPRIQFALGRLLPAWIRPRMEDLYGALASYREHPATLVQAIALSVVIQGLYALFFGIVAWGLKIPINVYYFLLFQPPVSLAMLAPISFGGLGVREAAFVLLFAEVGVAAADVLAVSLTAHLLNTLLSVWGALFMLGRKRAAGQPGAHKVV